MLDSLIWLGTILAVFFFTWGKLKLEAWPYFVALALFLTLGAGLLGTGWESFTGGNIVINDTNSASTLVSFETKTLDATLEANPILYVLGNVYFVLALIMLFFALREIGLNRAAKQNE